MAILIICPFFPPNIGGVETHLNLLTSHLQKKRIKTTVLTYRPLTLKTSYKKTENRPYLTIHRFNHFGYKIFDLTTPYPFLQFLYTVPILLTKSFLFMFKNHRQINCIHAHGFAAAFITRSLGLLFPNKKLILSTHYLYPQDAKMLKIVFSGFNHILAVSQASRKQLLRLGLSANKISVFRHWLNLNKFKSAKNKYKKFTVIFVGRIIKMKGVFNLLLVAKKLPRVQFLLIGQGPDFPKLKKLQKQQKNFTLLGKKNHHQIIPYLQKSHLFILPSIDKEGQPMVIMEALACGLPCLVTRLGSAKEMVNSQSGVIIPPHPKNIIETIDYLKKHPQKLKTMSKQARILATKNYSSQNADIITHTYKSHQNP